MKKIKAVECGSEKFRGYLMPHAWTLCTGAGISKGIAPDWFDLTHFVVSTCLAEDVERDKFAEIVKSSGWTLDSWIQAAANVHYANGGAHDQFRDFIESCLYSKVREKAKGYGLEKYLTTVLNFPNRALKDQIINVCQFIEHEFANSSLVQVGKFLIEANICGKSPKAILTFNADTFLETYITIKLREMHYIGPGPHGHPEYPFVQVTRPSNSNGVKTPIIHCHGSVSPIPHKGVPHRDARDRLIFLEEEYLAAASSGAAWAETMFLYYAQCTRMAFVGMSMSDSNVRRWMRATSLEKQKDELAFGFSGRINPDHLWVKPRPSELEQQLALHSLCHLGVRPAWINSWAELRHGLLNLCAANERI